jgi:transposase
MRDMDLPAAAARLTGCLLAMLEHGGIAPHHRSVVSELVADVRRANGMVDAAARYEADLAAIEKALRT